MDAMHAMKMPQQPNFHQSQLSTPPPTPDRRRALKAQQMRHSPLNKKGYKNTMAAERTSHAVGGMSKARPGNGKRLWKAEKNRVRRAVKDVFNPTATQVTQNTCVTESKERLSTPSTGDKKGDECLPGDSSLDVRFTHDASTVSNLAPEPQGCFGDDSDVGRHELHLGFDEAMLEDQSFESSSSGIINPVGLTLNEGSLNREIQDLSDTESSRSAQALPATDHQDHCNVTTALNLLLAMISEQTCLNNGCVDIEAQISRLPSTKFKIDCEAISKLEDELALKAGLSMEMFIAEWAFRDLLEVNKEIATFDLGGALGILAGQVEYLVEEFEAAMEKLK